MFIVVHYFVQSTIRAIRILVEYSNIPTTNSKITQIYTTVENSILSL